jgi:hypothetical protein
VRFGSGPLEANVGLTGYCHPGGAYSANISAARDLSPRLAPCMLLAMTGYAQSPGPYWTPPRKIGGPLLFLVLLAGFVMLMLALAAYLLAAFG